MFCGNCGSQIADGSAVCPNCGAQMAPKSQAPSMNQGASFQNPGFQNSQYQNPQGGYVNQGASAAPAPKKANFKLIGILAACVVVIALVVVLAIKLLGGSGPKGTYTDGETLYTFDKNTLTISGDGLEVSFEYKMDKEDVVVDVDSFDMSDSFWTYVANEFDVDVDDLEEYLEDYADYSDEAKAMYDALKNDDYDDLEEMILKEMDVDEDDSDLFTYNKKDNTLKNKNTKDKLYYAQDYKKGPSGKYTSKEDDDITISFKNGTATYDNDGDKEEITYYVYVEKKDVHVIFAGEDFEDSEFKEEYNTRTCEYDSKKDKLKINGDDFKK